MVPACLDLNIVNYNAESITVKSIPKPSVDKPTIKGYKLKWSNNRKMIPLVGETDVLPCGKGNYSINGLDTGKAYYVTASYIGDFEEGEPTRPYCVLLAGMIHSCSFYCTTCFSHSR
jgi:hypothetical protein